MRLRPWSFGWRIGSLFGVLGVLVGLLSVLVGVPVILVGAFLYRMAYLVSLALRWRRRYGEFGNRDGVSLSYILD